eukprot:scaffold12470_cov119-Isochrysis_galbana.AAC.2
MGARAVHRHVLRRSTPAVIVAGLPSARAQLSAFSTGNRVRVSVSCRPQVLTSAAVLCPLPSTSSDSSPEAILLEVVVVCKTVLHLRRPVRELVGRQRPSEGLHSPAVVVAALAEAQLAFGRAEEAGGGQTGVDAPAGGDCAQLEAEGPGLLIGQQDVHVPHLLRHLVQPPVPKGGEGQLEPLPLAKLATATRLVAQPQLVVQSSCLGVGEQGVRGAQHFEPLLPGQGGLGWYERGPLRRDPGKCTRGMMYLPR